MLRWYSLIMVVQIVILVFSLLIIIGIAQMLVVQGVCLCVSLNYLLLSGQRCVPHSTLRSFLQIKTQAEVAPPVFNVLSQSSRLTFQINLVTLWAVFLFPIVVKLSYLPPKCSGNTRRVLWQRKLLSSCSGYIFLFLCVCVCVKVDIIYIQKIIGFDV